MASPTRRLLVSSTGRTFSTARLRVVTLSAGLRRHLAPGPSRRSARRWSASLQQDLVDHLRHQLRLVDGGQSGAALVAVGPLRGIRQFLLDLLALGAVARAGSLAVADALGVEGAADDLVRDAGRSFTRPPRTSTMECSCRLRRRPGCGETSMPLDSRNLRHTLRSAELLLGRGRRRCADATPLRVSFSAGVLVFSTHSRPLRTSWAIVGNLAPCRPSWPTVPAARSTPRRRAFIPLWPPSTAMVDSSWSGLQLGPRVPAGGVPRRAGRRCPAGRASPRLAEKRDQEW